MSEREDLSYEKALEELVEVVRRLESGGVPLAESMALWQRGEKLATICQGHLDDAKRRIEESQNKSSAKPAQTD